MTRRKHKPKAEAAGLLERLSPEEATAVLRQLLNKHRELRSEAELLATELVSSCSIDEVAGDAHNLITNIELDDLNERAGSHSWGYVEPSEGAVELLQEALEDLIEEMKRNLELG